MPTNLYGPNDNFDLQNSHVLPAFIRKFHEATEKKEKEVVVWGSGKPLREFLYVEDLADAILFLMENVNAEDLYEKGITHLNIGTGKDISIDGLANMITEIVGYKGSINHDTSKPDGTPRKLLDVSRINSLGWKYRTELRVGIEKTYYWFLKKLEVRS
jgi:GDP-L-fucose synthase